MVSNMIKQNLKDECEALLNKQINMYLEASYFYESIASYYNHSEVSLQGFGKYFKEKSIEKLQLSSLVIDYQSKRGGTVVLKLIEQKASEDPKSSLEAFESCLKLERDLNQWLLDFHTLSRAHQDAQLADFLRKEHLKKQMELIFELSTKIEQLKRATSSSCLGEYIFNEMSFQFNS